MAHGARLIRPATAAFVPLPDAERAAVGQLRDLREINDDVYRRVLHELDLEEAYIKRR